MRKCAIQKKKIINFSFFDIIAYRFFSHHIFPSAKNKSSYQRTSQQLTHTHSHKKMDNYIILKCDHRKILLNLAFAIRMPLPAPYICVDCCSLLVHPITTVRNQMEAMPKDNLVAIQKRFCRFQEPDLAFKLIRKFGRPQINVCIIQSG